MLRTTCHCHHSSRNCDFLSRVADGLHCDDFMCHLDNEVLCANGEIIRRGLDLNHAENLRPARPRNLLSALGKRLSACLLSCTIAWSVSAFGANAVESSDAETRHAHVRVGIEGVKFPGNESVGVVGTSYLVDVWAARGVSFGPAVFGAASGKRGGFFTFGAEAAWRAPLAGPLGVVLGAYVGGGGGSGAAQGGGLMLRPHADLLWDLGPYALGVTVSNVRFPNGRIDSTQIGLLLDVSRDFAFFPAERLQSVASTTGRTGVGFNRLQTIASVYRTRSGSKLIDGSLQPRDIVLVGARAEQALGGNAYWGLEANGAARAGVAGYAEYLASVALESATSDQFRVGARLALGIGGGGGMPVGGGLLVKGSVYGVIPVSRQLGLLVESGLVTAPRGELRAATVSASLVWALEGAISSGAATRPVRTDFSVGVERFRAGRRGGGNQPLTADVLKVDRFLSPNFYLTGQVHSAVSGNAGGYSMALLGLGWTQPLASRWDVGAEVLAGASGGGGVDSHGSAAQAGVYAAFRLTPSVALLAGEGWVKSPRGTVSSHAVNFGLIATYGVAAP